MMSALRCSRRDSSVLRLRVVAADELVVPAGGDERGVDVVAPQPRLAGLRISRIGAPGWRAMNSSTRAAVASVEPSSTTRISQACEKRPRAPSSVSRSGR
jgi:hypothetical protein